MRGYTPIKIFHHLLRCNDLFGMSCIGLYHDNSNCDDQDCNPSCIRKDQIRLHLLLAFNWRASHLHLHISCMNLQLKKNWFSSLLCCQTKKSFFTLLNPKGWLHSSLPNISFPINQDLDLLGNSLLSKMFQTQLFVDSIFFPQFAMVFHCKTALKYIFFLKTEQITAIWQLI